jgi:flagellar basal-body rod protein FlgG
MISGLYTAASGMAAHELKLDLLANNLANADTPGFKADLATIGLSDASPDGMRSSSSSWSTVVADRGGLDPSPGILKPTGNPLDIAILGRGLFVVQTSQGERYTRAGSFTRDSDGFLTTPQGFRVLGTSGPIRVPEKGLEVDARGRLADGASFRLVAGPDGSGLVKEGANLFAVAPGARRPADLPEATVVQGQLESSNVNVIRTMVEMLAAVRTYEAYQRTIQALNDTAGQAINDVGRA